MAHLAIPWKTNEWGSCALLAGIAVVPVVTILLARQAAHDPTALGWLGGIAASGALVLAAALANLARVVLAIEELWPIVVVLSALGAELVVATAVGEVADLAARPSTTWVMLADIGLLVAVLGVVTVALRRGLRPPPLALGALVGAGVATLLIAPPVELAEPSVAVGAALSAVILVGYALAALLVRRHWPWSTGSRTSVSLALLALGTAHALQGHAGTATWTGLAAAGADLLAAVLLGTTLYAVVNGDFFADRRRFTALREQLLEGEEASRRERADRHALRNMVAGISMASELLEEDDLEEPTRRRLEHTIHVEAMHLRRFLDESTAPPLVDHHHHDHDGSLSVPSQLAR